MAEKSDDIKQLFSHLGLNPSDYQEIRSAPSANATVTETPRRWSLLQATSKHPLPTKIEPIVPTTSGPSAMPTPAPAAVPRAVAAAAPAPAQWAALSPRATVSVPMAPVVVPPPAVAAPVADDQPLAEGLRSLFQSVREPPPVAPLPSAPTVLVPPPAEPSADEVYRELRGNAPGRAAPPPENPPPPAWASYDAEQETRYALPPTPAQHAVPAPAPKAAPASPPRALSTPPASVPTPAPPPVAAAARAKPARPAPAPMPAAAPVRAPAAVVASDLQAAFRRLAEPEPPRAAASGRLRLRYPAAPQAQADSSREARLDDVLRRISGHNGPTK
jgi:hypothetical protein